MNISDKPVLTVPYDDKVKTYEELAKRGSSVVFFLVPLAKKMGDSSVEFKTDKSKTSNSIFGRKVLTDNKSPPLFLGQFSFQPIIFFVFVFSFSLFQRIGS
jgi:hypothetical protein